LKIGELQKCSRPQNDGERDAVKLEMEETLLRDSGCPLCSGVGFWREGPIRQTFRSAAAHHDMRIWLERRKRMSEDKDAEDRDSNNALFARFQARMMTGGQRTNKGAVL
jgi:hypothetical protein